MPSPSLRALLHGARQRSLLLDSNLLLLWLTAKYDMRLLGTFKRVQMFTQDDAVLLAWVVDQFGAVVTTAHVVTEASNLGNSLSSYTRNGWFKALAELCLTLSEDTPPLTSLALKDEFIQFGITDCALSSSSAKYQVLTTDYRLSRALDPTGQSVLNFADLRKMS